MKESKKVILHLIVSEIKKGNGPAKISKNNNIKPQTLQYYLRQLRKDKVICKEGYGLWRVLKEVSKTSKATKQVKQIRGHAFNWRVRFKQEIDWKRRLKENNIKYQLIGINKTTPRIIFNGKKIWLTKTGLVIYEPQSFFSASSYTSKGMAVWELDSTVKMLGRALKISLEGYRFTTSREHYGMIKNEMARQYNDKGDKLFISDDEGIWLWIDDSHGLAELETNEPTNSRMVQGWYNDMKKTKFEVTPTFILETINKTNDMIMQNAKNHSYYAENLKSHVEAVQTLSKSVKELKDEVIRLKNIK